MQSVAKLHIEKCVGICRGKKKNKHQLSCQAKDSNIKFFRKKKSIFMYYMIHTINIGVVSISFILYPVKTRQHEYW